MIFVAFAGPILAALHEIGDDGVIVLYGLGICSWPILMISAVLGAFDRLKGGDPVAEEVPAGGLTLRRIRTLVLRWSALNVLLTVAVAMWSGQLEASVLILAGFISLVIGVLAFAMLAGVLLMSPRDLPPR